MATTQKQQATLTEALADLPKNWGRWGEADEIGCLNYQGADLEPGYGEEVPLIRYATEDVSASGGERDPGACDEVFDGV